MLALRVSRARVRAIAPSYYHRVSQFPATEGSRRTITTHQDAEKGVKGSLPVDVSEKEEHIIYNTKLPEAQGLSKGYFIAIAVIVGVLAAAKYERSNPGKNPITRMIEYYAERQADVEERNARKTNLLEQAGRDRSLLFDSKPSKVIPLRFPEQLNAGSPFNSEAGWTR